ARGPPRREIARLRAAQETPRTFGRNSAGQVDTGLVQQALDLWPGRAARPRKARRPDRAAFRERGTSTLRLRDLRPDACHYSCRGCTPTSGCGSDWWLGFGPSRHGGWVALALRHKGRPLYFRGETLAECQAWARQHWRPGFLHHTIAAVAAADDPTAR